MGFCSRRLSKPLIACLFSLVVLILNLAIYQRDLAFYLSTSSQVAKGDGDWTERDSTLSKRRLLLSSRDKVESDPTFAQVVDNIPEISEQRFIEALQLNNLKIYVYRLPTIFNKDQVRLNALKPPKIWDPNCTANFYSAEYSLHQFLFNSKLRTLNPKEADFFYVPAYSCCFLINNHPNNLTKTGIFHKRVLNHIRKEYPFFNLSQGRDHVWAFTQGFGAKLFGDWRLINNGIFLVHNGQFTLDDFTPHKDISIPPDLTGYNFSSVFELPESERPMKKWLGHFGGTVLPITLTDERGSHYSKGVRQYIKEHFTDDKDFRITGTRIKTYIQDMMSSTFCLCPEGWHAWNPRPYQAVLLGCIPVLLSEEIELAFEEVLDYDKFMVRIKPSHMSDIKTILEAIPDSQVRAMQSEMEKVWRLFSYGKKGLAPLMVLKMLARRKTPRHIQRTYY